MSRFAIFAQVDQSRMNALQRIRPEHYRYLLAHQGQIVFGGPTRTPGTGAAETMVIVVEAGDEAEARAFIENEPYNRNGCFRQVDVRAWSQVLPESEPGALARTVAELNPP